MLIGKLCGMATPAGCHAFLEERMGILRMLLPFEEGIPSLPTLYRRLGAIPKECMEELFFLLLDGSFVLAGEMDVIAIDGKVERGCLCQPSKASGIVAVMFSK